MKQVSYSDFAAQYFDVLGVDYNIPSCDIEVIFQDYYPKQYIQKLERFTEDVSSQFFLSENNNHACCLKVVSGKLNLAKKLAGNYFKKVELPRPDVFAFEINSTDVLIIAFFYIDSKGALKNLQKAKFEHGLEMIIISGSSKMTAFNELSQSIFECITISLKTMPAIAKFDLAKLVAFFCNSDNSLLFYLFGGFDFGQFSILKLSSKQRIDFC